MTGDLNLKLRLTADGKGFRGEVRVAKRDLDKLTGSTRRGQQANRDYNRSSQNVELQTRKTSQSMSEGHKRALRYAKSIATVSAAYRVVSTVIRNTVTQEQALAQVEARLKSTGNAVGLTVDELARMAAGLQDVTTFGDEAILQMQSLLLSFRGISGDNFERATEAILDLSVGIKTDLRSAAIQLGKALDDPSKGLDALSRSGTRFSDAQKDMIESMVNAGRVADAQALILREIEVQYGGAARAARETFGGALDALSNKWNDLFEVQRGTTESWRHNIEALTAAIGRIDVEALHADLGRIASAAEYIVYIFAARLGGGAVASALKGANKGIGTISTTAAGATGNMKLLVGASAALKGSLALLGGPAGAAILAAVAIAKIAANSLEARSRLLLLPPAIEDVAEAVTKLTAAEKELLKPQIVGELTDVTKRIEAIQNNTAFNAGEDTPLQRGLEAKIEQLKAEEVRLSKVLRELYRPTPAQGAAASTPSGVAPPAGNSAAFATVLAALADQEKKIRASYAKQIAAVQEATPQQVEALKAQGLTVAQAVRELETLRDAEIAKLSSGGSKKSDPFVRTLDALKGQEQRIRERYAAQIAAIRAATAEQVQALKAQGLTVTQAIQQIETRRDAELKQVFDGSKHQQAVAEINEAVLSLQPPLAQAQAAAEAWRASTKAGLDTTAAGYADLAAKVEHVYQERIAQALAEDVERRRQAAEEVLANSTRWQDGMLRALDRYNQSAVNAAGLAENATTRALQSMQGALDHFAETGKLRFGDFARSVLADLTRIAAHRAFSSLFAGLFGGSQAALIAGQTGFDGGVGGVLSGAEFAAFHAGGIVGKPPPLYRRVSPAVFAGARRYHNGGLAGDEVPAILKRREEVLPADHPRHRDNMGSGTVVINQSFDFRNADESTEPRLRAEAAKIKEETKAEILNYLGNTRRGLALTGRG